MLENAELAMATLMSTGGSGLFCARDGRYSRAAWNQLAATTRASLALYFSRRLPAAMQGSHAHPTLCCIISAAMHYAEASFAQSPRAGLRLSYHVLDTLQKCEGSHALRHATQAGGHSRPALRDGDALASLMARSAAGTYSLLSTHMPKDYQLLASHGEYGGLLRGQLKERGLCSGAPAAYSLACVYCLSALSVVQILAANE